MAFSLAGKNAFNSVYDLPYCNQSDATYRGSKYECEFFENIGAQIVSNGALMVLTRQKAMDEVLVCDASSGMVDGTCPFIYNARARANQQCLDARRGRLDAGHGHADAVRGRRGALHGARRS